MYSKMAEEEDKKLADRWQKDADGMLVFVSHAVISHVGAPIDRKTIDRFILCGRRHVHFGVGPGSEAQLPR
jgi:hypothetical protein